MSTHSQVSREFKIRREVIVAIFTGISGQCSLAGGFLLMFEPLPVIREKFPTSFANEF